MNCLLYALAMYLGLKCVLFWNVMELLSCSGGRLCAKPCILGRVLYHLLPYLFCL